MNNWKTRTAVAGIALATFVALSALMPRDSRSQTPSLPPPPYNVDTGALITNTIRAPGTVDTAQQDNLAYRGVMCTFNMTATSGGPSSTIEIQAYDAASATYRRLAISGAITALNTPTAVLVYPGAVATSVPTGLVIAGLPLPRKWRLEQVITGSGTLVTGTVGCNLLR